MMRNIKAVSLLFACIFMIPMFASCSTRSTINIVKVEAKELQEPDSLDSAIRTVALGTEDFAFKLSAELSKNIKNENFVCSPYSVWLPLAALVNATDAKDQDALLNSLNASGISIDDINRASSWMLNNLAKLTDGYNPIKTANAIFVNKDFTIRKDFAQKFMDFYMGNSISVDFKSKNAVKVVNDWASKQTNGLIPNLVQQFDPDTITAIANAIYFSDRWQWEFKPEETTEG
ncbi:MAG: hypothetical protein FWC47_16180, partial [Oscillospiraceae bacterium]|nr:hypothetical protein [Oscillospiraceae bacterium]